MLYSTPPSSSENSVNSPSLEILALREQISALGSEVSRITSERMAAAHRAADAGADYARENVEQFPLASLAVAFAAGALIGLAVVPPRRATPNWQNSSLSGVRDDLADYTKQLKRSIRGTATGRGLLSNMERVADTVSSVDAKASIGPVWNRLLSWLEAAKDRASIVASDLSKVS